VNRLTAVPLDRSWLPRMFEAWEQKRLRVRPLPIGQPASIERHRLRRFTGIGVLSYAGNPDRFHEFNEPFTTRSMPARRTAISPK